MGNVLPLSCRPYASEGMLADQPKSQKSALTANGLRLLRATPVSPVSESARSRHMVPSRLAFTL